MDSYMKAYSPPLAQNLQLAVKGQLGLRVDRPTF
jgi:hypothetical protein